MVKIIDCTLRDGGYYCDWDFESDTVRKYLAAISTAKVDIVEIGFRFFPKGKFLGAHAYSTDEYLKTLPLCESISLAVMVNAKELIDYAEGVEEAIDSLFSPKKESPIDIVRVAVHVASLRECESIVKKLRALGYRVFLNLMQISSAESKELPNIGEVIAGWKGVEVLYFADSFGDMDPESVCDVVSELSKGWQRPLGVHTHDNKGMALSNCVESVKCGVEYLDSTILGMGRGAGNVKTENLLVELSQRGYGEYFPDALFPLVLQDFNTLQQTYGWGPNIYYFLSAVHGIHPTYIQEMLGDGRYDTDHILSAINFLKSTKAPFYSFEKMLRAISGVEGNEHGSNSVSRWSEDKTVLILGSGPSTAQYLRAIDEFISKTKPVVLCLNMNESVPENLVTAYVTCHETRILMESDHYRDLSQPLIIPLSRVPDSIIGSMDGVDIIDYGLRISEDLFEIYDDGCVLDGPLAVAYAMAFATASGAKNIYLAGVDGYGASDPRQAAMVDMFVRYQNLRNSLRIAAITPTTYPIEKRSVFEPGL